MLSLQRITKGLSAHLLKRMSSSTATATAKTTSTSTETNSVDANGSNEAKKERKSLVAAAFESLKQEKKGVEQSKDKVSTKDSGSYEDQKGNTAIAKKLLSATTVNSLLSVAESSGPLTRKDALKIVSILSEWSTLNRVKLSEFENDERFLKVCRLLGRTTKVEKSKAVGYRSDDLNTVLGIAGDDEAAKLVASISVPQMVKVMASLAQRKRRSTPLLRALAYNISSSSDPLNLKQCGDILFAMSTLNFPDSVLTAKVCSDILVAVPKHTEKSAAIGSILTSLGILKYRDLDVLEILTDWISKNNDNCRPQDLNALFLTLGTLNCKDTEIKSLNPKLVNSLSEGDFLKKIDLLNYVWALCLMRLADEKYLKLVLSPNFIQELKNDHNDLTPNLKMKLLNINAYARLLFKDFKGSFLSPESDTFSVTITYSKSKQVFLNGMLDALKSLLPSTTYLKSLSDTQMGFLIDAQCILDAKTNPLPLDKEHKDGIKIAMMVVDFHDTCHGPHKSITGITSLSFDLLEKSGYKILPVFYNEFSISDKLLKRVQYLETNLKNIVKKNI